MDIDEKKKVSKALYGMVAFGFGEVTGGITWGYLIDKIGSKKTVFANLLVMIVMTTVTLFSIH